jgi:hypothetical protein
MANAIGAYTGSQQSAQLDQPTPAQQEESRQGPLEQKFGVGPQDTVSISPEARAAALAVQPANATERQPSLDTAQTSNQTVRLATETQPQNVQPRTTQTRG